jgi:hypothetical protein
MHLDMSSTVLGCRYSASKLGIGIGTSEYRRLDVPEFGIGIPLQCQSKFFSPHPLLLNTELHPCVLTGNVPTSLSASSASVATLLFPSTSCATLRRQATPHPPLPRRLVGGPRRSGAYESSPLPLPAISPLPPSAGGHYAPSTASIVGGLCRPSAGESSPFPT